MRLPALAAMTAFALSVGSSGLAQSTDNDRSPSGSTISEEERATQLSPTAASPRFLVLGAPVRPAPASAPAPAPVKRKLTLGSMPWLTGAYN